MAGRRRPGACPAVSAPGSSGGSAGSRTAAWSCWRACCAGLATFGVAAGTLALGATLFLFVGRDHFPQIDAGQMQLHVRARLGVRIEEAGRLLQQVEDTIREVVPARDLGGVLDNIGLPANNYNLAFSDGSIVACNDGQVLASLKPGHAATAGSIRTLRRVLAERFPSAVFYFQPAGIVTQVLNFGLPAPIDVQVAGRDKANRAAAQAVLTKLKRVRRCRPPPRSRPTSGPTRRAAERAAGPGRPRQHAAAVQRRHAAPPGRAEAARARRR